MIFLNECSRAVALKCNLVERTRYHEKKYMYQNASGSVLHRSSSTWPALLSHTPPPQSVKLSWHLAHLIRTTRLLLSLGPFLFQRCGDRDGHSGFPLNESTVSPPVHQMAPPGRWRATPAAHKHVYLCGPALSVLSQQLQGKRPGADIAAGGERQQFSLSGS